MMRPHPGLLAALLLTACNSILHNDQRYLVPAGGSGGTAAGGSGGGGGTSASPDPSTAGQSDQAASCVGVPCDDARAPHCETDSKLRTYDPVGSCDAGICTYVEHVIDCECKDDACTSDACKDVKCDQPPQPRCKDDLTRTTFADEGECVDGSCSYPATDDGCSLDQHCDGVGVCR